MKGYIYQIENLITHESYIGQTVDINRRKNTHFNKLRKINMTTQNYKIALTNTEKKNFIFAIGNLILRIKKN